MRNIILSSQITHEELNIDGLGSKLGYTENGESRAQGRRALAYRRCYCSNNGRRHLESSYYRWSVLSTSQSLSLNRKPTLHSILTLFKYEEIEAHEEHAQSLTASKLQRSDLNLDLPDWFFRYALFHDIIIIFFKLGSLVISCAVIHPLWNHRGHYFGLPHIGHPWYRLRFTGVAMKKAYRKPDTRQYNFLCTTPGSKTNASYQG